MKQLPLILVTVGLSAAQLSCGPSGSGNEASGTSDASSVDIVGSWRLEEWTLGDGTSRCSEEEGGSSGQIAYTSDGHMSAQLGCSEIDTADLSGLSPREVAARLSRRHFSYYGAYTLDEAAQTVTHHVEGSSSIPFVGSDRVRSFVFEGPDRIVLSPQESNSRLVWLRNR